MRWLQITVIARRISTTTTQRPRQNREPRYPLRPMTPNVPWIAAPPDISGAERQFQQTLFFPHWQ
ncbi:MAG TPA: hypothetical protein VNZ47_04695 [Candidatus Dormibacteraeota bacterium]|nr:hypothetical protein [Candidatus Dormibacteraeota bacterium]